MTVRFHILLCSLPLLIALCGNLMHTASATPPVPNYALDAVISKVKKGAHYFTECSIDSLAAHCTAETAINFECFRTIGNCIPGTIRAALVDDEEDNGNTSDEDDNEQSDEL